ncbi:MAG TPA: hypothetical protein VNN73_07120 [Blastocatellia bacterium]|nr:hypothetical protein [Blastocatellia bacterium]
MKTLVKPKSVAILVIAIIFLATLTTVASKHSVQDKGDLPGGNWSFSAHPYMGPDLDGRPVIVSSVETSADKGLQLTKVALKNRSSKPVTAVKLVWSLSYEQSRDIALQNGTTNWFDLPKSIPVGQTKVLKFRVPPVSFASISRPLVRGHFLDGDFYFAIAVGAVRYEDGSSWIAINYMGGGRLIKASSRASTYQVGCAKQKCKNLGGSGYKCEDSTDSEYCTNCQTSCSATLCGNKPPGCGDGGGDELLIE